MKVSDKYLKICMNLLFALFVVFAILYLVPKLLIYFAPFVIGWILSFIANPLVKFLEKKVKITRKYGSAIMIIAVIALIVLAIYGICSGLVHQAQEIVTDLPSIYESAGADLGNAATSLEKFVEALPGDFTLDLSGIRENLSEYFSTIMQNVGEPTVSAIKSIPNALVGIIMTFMSAYFFIADKQKISDAVRKNVPQSVQMRASEIYQQLMRGVGGYFKAQLKIMVVVYVLLVIGFLLLDVQLPWLVAFLTAFLDMLPVFGTGTILVPWAVIQVFSGKYEMALGLVILYAVTQIVRQVIQPKILGDTIGMNTFAALFFMYVGWKMYGVIGMIVAVPLGMILINLYKAGAFENLTWSIHELISSINEFRKKED